MKARLVADGRYLKEGIDYKTSFSSVVRESTLRILLHVVAAKNYEIDTVDVTAAYLYAPIQDEVYIQIPEYVNEKKGNGRCYKLLKSMYGLPQSGRNWQETATKALSGMGFQPSAGDPCLFIRAGEEGSEYIAMYVDDLCVAAPNRRLTDAIKENLANTFALKNGGQISEYLGLRTIRNTTGTEFEIIQTGLIQDILAKFAKSDSAVAHTPMAARYRPSQGIWDCDPDTINFYQSAVGSLLYLCRMSRPDITYAVGILGRYASCPAPDHLDALQRVINYLRGTSHFALRIDGKGKWLDIQC